MHCYRSIYVTIVFEELFPFLVLFDFKSYAFTPLCGIDCKVWVCERLHEEFSYSFLAMISHHLI